MDKPRASAPALTLEALLDEENKEVLAEIKRHDRSRSPHRPLARGVTPPPPVRSMLNVGGSTPRHGSIAGIGVGITDPRDQRNSATHLNPADPSTWTRPHRPSSPGPGRPSSESDPQYQEIPTIQVESDEKNEQTTEPRSPDRHASDENRKPTSSPRQSDTLLPESPTTKRHSPRPDSHRRRRSSAQSSSFSDVSDVPSEIITRATSADEDALADTSEDERRDWSSEGESPEAERGRGREKLPQTQEEMLAPQSKGVRSLVDPVSSPSRPHHSTDVHPPSSFGRSGPNLSDFEQDPMEADIQKAKTLGLNISPVDDSIADRHVRMIIRGEWGKLQEESEDSNSRSRLYLVCSDLSIEATYALEWTVGTMLRDGDTLLAIYAIEDETAPKETEGNREVMAESAKAAHDASETMATLTRQTTNLSITGKHMSSFMPATEAGSLAGSAETLGRSKKETERLKAMDEVTQNFLKLVRKTPLQVRCMVEVIHCKSPKHLILNAIDELDPTLCVVGTRGRSSLKGVLLGSFSNYLVTKSSVPVMVARKRLKKARHAKVNSANIRLSNNLTNSILPRQRKSLTQARID